MNKKIGFLTLGCKVNFYDTDAMIKIFLENDYEIVDFNQQADIYIINTCTVTNLSDKKSRQMIRKAKINNNNAIVIGTGCYAQTSPEEVLKIDGIDLIIGTKDRSKILEIIENYKINQTKKSYVTNIMEETQFEELEITSSKSKTRAYLKVQEGCNQYCSYCIIPFARGKIRSRLLDNVIKQVEILSNEGILEIVLAGIHIISYGNDLEDCTLVDLIEKVSQNEKIKRIRLSSIEPNFITKENLIRLKETKLCDFFHLSLQSGSDKILNLMNRKYNTNEFFKAAELIREYFPNAGITTDVIVGFPEENEEDFLDTYNFCQKIAFSKIHVFPFSAKKGTKAFLMENKIDEKTKNERCKKLRLLSDKLEKEFENKNLDKTHDILFENENENKNSEYEGFTSNYIKVFAKSDTNISNQIIKSKLIKKNNEKITCIFTS